MHALRIFGLLLITALVSGCGDSKLQPLQGSVTLDGEPLADAAISFSPVEGGRPASGKSDAGGQFTIASYTANDGLPPGSYKVTIVKISTKKQAEAAPSEDENETPENAAMGNIEQGVTFITPIKYSSPLTTDLIVDVAPGMEPVKLDITSK
ncbi:carboxypeptidase-like regulatory domain-containing protein [Blastopirellula sp. JC732]|uniref:Carboxypeptidase-like regulatory domain-containing protein n=1 Tax=Blastopirellula sediminis TaxID=2894196 RepID=A0A9X1MRS5_9BACT|nr:carboxypeptidase-like regulatory domain-containing protein [Blastopirellula sediminis]MCC9605854.1 carboxypeptidase-like regulatory domain-containing protein [Blastopirellula sediminis]MCC9630847.1 carboxypeptidase-like regulatory domain-containing protein [Blastopirellula sediminis]